MADKTGYRGALDANNMPIPELFTDNGDGTYSAGGGAGGGDATAANQTTEIARLEAIRDRLAAAVALADALSKPTTAPVGAWLVGYNGATGDLVRVQSIRKDLSAVAIGSITTVWTPASGKKVRLMGGSISVSAAASVLFEDNSAGNGTAWRTPKLLADTPYNFDLGNGYLLGSANNVLKATSSASANITGTLYGVEES